MAKCPVFVKDQGLVSLNVISVFYLGFNEKHFIATDAWGKERFERKPALCGTKRVYIGNDVTPKK